MKNLILIPVIVLSIVLLGCGDSDTDNPISDNGDATSANLPASDSDPSETARPDVDNPEPIEEKVKLIDKKWDDLTENQQYAFLVLGPGSRVVVENTLPEHGLHVRKPPGLHLGEANIIGHVLNRATGTIQSDAEIVGNLIWFEIEWDKNAADQCKLNNEGLCVGWSAAVSPNDTRFLSLVED